MAQSKLSLAKWAFNYDCVYKTKHIPFYLEAKFELFLKIKSCKISKKIRIL